MVSGVEHRFYTSVAGNTEATSDYVVPDGSRLVLQEIGASPAEFSSMVELTWDPSGENLILLATSRESRQTTTKELVGDGVKKLRIKLTNNDTISKKFGAYAIGGLGNA